MERQAFLKTLGISFAAVCLGSCFSDCSKKNDLIAETNIPPQSKIVSVNLSNLNTIGAKVTISGIAFFRIANGDTATSFIATQALCTHQDGELEWKQNENLLQCRKHAAQFKPNGENIGLPFGETKINNLKTYAITLIGEILNAKIV